MSFGHKGLLISKPGASATVQDVGRTGFRHHGLAKGGAMDLHAFYWANKLLGNALDAACLEILLGGFEARAETDITIAVTGACADVAVNGQASDLWQTIELKAGDTLNIGHAKSGRILYLALPGGIKSPEWFASQSVVPREKIKGLEPLKVGGHLAAARPQQNIGRRWLPLADRPDYSRDLRLTLIPGYQHHQFSKQDLLRLTTHDYQVTQQSDRMGYRLQGPALQDVPSGIISEGIADGALQVPGDGQPIALMNDCQTIGGYPKPGVIAAVGRYRLSQRLPGQSIRFEFGDLADAQNELRLFNRFFAKSQWRSEKECWTWE
ncbi:biotin-dependent carboxyltransferase family protein [Marinobacter sp. CHS3-4]|uniref:5-oxoprolinase subunit C family protein n=1 Tax=Marinobacter sp. CHS3-4 TaxID=3045174 RepID=UPI0024B4FECC|nr:biotin-dependent carboxyltransferase family protein [Marinobacter sp. CHS3-4]MDI9245459.1 biotin-dependent carboxyltransferase family protein [Marinobacter sp. CHS3-4]